MGKIKKDKIVFDIISNNRITWSDIKIFDFQDSDIINMEYDEIDDCDFRFSVIRYVEETDEEYETRMKIKQVTSEIHRKNRYKTYLALKEEFGD